MKGTKRRGGVPLTCGFSVRAGGWGCSAFPNTEEEGGSNPPAPRE
jgi:hypothetical protein